MNGPQVDTPVRSAVSSPPPKKFKPSTSLVPPSKLTAISGSLQSGETVLWIGAPDKISTLRTQSVFLYIGAPWTAVALALYFSGMIAADWEPFVIAPGLVFLAAPVLIAIYAGGTIYAITDRRALIKHDALGKRQNVSVAFEEMDDRLEILPVRPGIGHLYFASGASSRVSDADYTGRLAFRELAQPEAVAQVLERARAQWKAAHAPT